LETRTLVSFVTLDEEIFGLRYIIPSRYYDQISYLHLSFSFACFGKTFLNLHLFIFILGVMGKAGSKPEDLRTSSDAERKTRYKHSPTSHKSLDVATMLALTAQRDIKVELRDKIAAAQRTKFIDLENCQLALFPGEILTSCPDLTQVQLSQNSLTDLPPEMSVLKSLAVLRLSSNKLKTIPYEVLTSLDQLQILDISRNIFTSLPKGTTAWDRSSDLY
jgi:hypothetical protein